MDDTLIFVAGAGGILLAGIGIGFFISQLMIGRKTAKADDVQQEFDEYRREVTRHFGRTAEHFQAIGQQYRELYEHMAVGADALCERDAIDEKLSFKPAAILESAVVDSDPNTQDAPRDYAEDSTQVDETPGVESPDDVVRADDEPDRAPDDAAVASVAAAAEDDEAPGDGDDGEDDAQPKKDADDAEAQHTLH